MHQEFYAKARRERKSELLIETVKYCLAVNKKLALGTADVDAMYDRIKKAFPDAKLTKYKHYLLVEK